MISSIYYQALLSSAAYAVLRRGTTASQIIALVLSDLADAEAAYLAQIFDTVEAYFDDRNVARGGSDTGFQVTVFKEAASSNLTIAFRGTTLGDDSSTGVDMLGAGAVTIRSSR